MDVLPGFREGMRNVALDEQRHIGFGVKLLADLYAELGEPVADAIGDVLREVLPWTTAVAAPPGWDRRYTESFGFTIEDLGEAGAASLEQKLRAIGLEPEKLRVPMFWSLPPRERAERGMRMLRANVIGPGGPIDSSPEIVQMMFEAIPLQADSSQVPAGTTIQWAFTDVDPWHVVIDNGSTRSVKGLAANPDLTLTTSFSDWADLSAGRADPRKLILTRRLKPKGKLRVMMKLQKVFG